MWTTIDSNLVSAYPDIVYSGPQRFSVEHLGDSHGKGVRATCSISAGELIAHISGIVTRIRGQHTLQLNEYVHILDLHFVGMLSHSCEPNVAVDLVKFTVKARTDIAAGEILTMDYASTEDILHRQFKCMCGSLRCRGWITGREERRQVPTDD